LIVNNTVFILSFACNKEPEKSFLFFGGDFFVVRFVLIERLGNA
jgi:hypothetical protein